MNVSVSAKWLLCGSSLRACLSFTHNLTALWPEVNLLATLANVLAVVSEPRTSAASKFRLVNIKTNISEPEIIYIFYTNFAIFSWKSIIHKPIDFGQTSCSKVCSSFIFISNSAHTFLPNRVGHKLHFPTLNAVSSSVVLLQLQHHCIVGHILWQTK